MKTIAILIGGASGWMAGTSISKFTSGEFEPALYLMLWAIFLFAISRACRHYCKKT